MSPIDKFKLIQSEIVNKSITVDEFIHKLIGHNFIDLCKTMFEKYPYLIQTQNSVGMSPLMSAISQKRHALIKYLIPKSNLMHVNIYGITVLDATIITNNYRAANIILEQLRNCNLISPNINKSFLLAIRESNYNIINMLIEYGDIDINPDIIERTQPIDYAIMFGDRDIINLLIENGAIYPYPREYNGDSDRLMHIAAKENHVDIIQTLVEIGVDINITNTKGETILHTAATNNNTKLFNWLVDNGCAIDKADNDGISATFCAKLYRRQRIIDPIIYPDITDLLNNDNSQES